jgi:ParB family transcriptional regulator, chromosome partitioning protein
VVKPKSLGRGLDSLISGASGIMAAQQSASTDPAALPLVVIDSIIPNPRQPRRIFPDNDPLLLELRDSIIEHGLIQPIIVARLDTLPTDEKSSSDWFGDGFAGAPVAGSAEQSPVVKYQIIAGERRWRASKLAKLEKVPVVIKDVTPQEMLELALIENIQRADLNPIEEALAYQALIQEYGLTQEVVAKQVGKHRSTVTNSLRLLQLPPQLRDMLVNQAENFSEGHARALLGIENAEDQTKAMKQIVALRLTVRQAEELVERVKNVKNAESVETALEHVAMVPSHSPELAGLESEFREALMVKVDLKYNTRGKGTLVLHFNSQNELDSLYERLVKPQEEP